MYHYPPAVSDFDLPFVLRNLIRDTEPGLDAVLCQEIGCLDAVSGSSWVLLLSLLLRKLKEHNPGRSEVITTRYSCNEFSKAPLLAGLRPVYVELDADLRTNVDRMVEAITDKTLAVYAINNVGVESDNRALAQRCRERGVACIEDATYTYFGKSDRYGTPFGTFGDFAILNFSEGKIIPVGGGAVLLNNAEYRPVFESVRSELAAAPERSSLRELLGVLVYKLGSSKPGYSAYRSLHALIDVDLKSRFSMEPTRPGETGMDLKGDAAGIDMPEERKQALSQEGMLAPLSRVKQLCGISVARNAEHYRKARKAKYDYLVRRLAELNGVELLPLPVNGMPVRVPILVKRPLSEEAYNALSRYGVSNHYTTAYPMYGDPRFPNANRFYENLYTLPVHRYADIDRLVDALAQYTSGSTIASADAAPVRHAEPAPAGPAA